MYKKIIAAFAASLAVAFSANAQDDSKYFDGLYLSADLGIEDSGDFYYGGSLGYRFQSETNWVFGVEGNFGDLTSSDTSGTVTAAIDYAWGVTGILGYAFGEKDNNLVFVNAGYGELDLSVSSPTESDSEAFGGFRGSFGYERAISDRISLRLVGTYQDVSDFGEALIGTAGFVVKF
jgi:hypothetical protein